MGRPLPAELAALALLDGATPAQLAAVADQMVRNQAPAGVVLGREGDPGAVFWLILEGEVDVTAAVPGGRRKLARAGAGSVLGELALLRDTPRTATLTTATACRYLSGGRPALDALLAIDAVRSRMRLLASRRLAADLNPVTTELRDGTPVLLRPLLASDRNALDDALHELSHQSLRRRFFSAGTPSPAVVDYLVDIDYVDHFAWAVLDAANHDGLAVARYVRTNASQPAEMAFTTVDRFQRRGLATLLLGTLGVTALEAGVKGLSALVMEDNLAMRRVFARAGARAAFYEPGLLSVTVEVGRAAALVDQPLRHRIAAAVHDVVTAASLALA